MTSKTVRNALRATAIGAASLALTGCLGPTYGTGKSQGETLFDDLNNVVSLGGDNKSAEIAYAPRPELVKPENTGVLPAPQTARNTTGDPNWPESPEQRSARLQAAAYQGDGPMPADVATARKEGVTQAYLDRTSSDGFDFGKNNDDAPLLTPQQLRSRGELVRARLKERAQGSPAQRKYLSEPPVAYRQPAATAPVGDPGVDESVKERRLRGSGEGLGSKIRDLLPF
ncbi:hypothetical protein H9Q09_17925 [Aurantimonas sp. DM33-3]|uniref:hypothetical protein n=1 Tax=Aurantimonas sp. DM33-3 TaxID=2766955 RepID=UPI001652A7B6|nr:hypothetical protein [Aurantimonas sp. DM33-3]MBC6718067.1 hypothetical protein [Aurantimonas sp. DM33-3]